MTIEIINGDCQDVLKTLSAESVQTCVTSPPYFGLRNYGNINQVGFETDSDLYITKIINIMREVGRVLRPDGTLWLNLGDSTIKKQLQGIPWRVALALQSEGWFLRSSIIWHKPNPMPESVTDRPTSAHEHVFLLSKRGSYFYDAAAIQEPANQPIGQKKRTGQGKMDAMRIAGTRNSNGLSTSTLGSNQGNPFRNCRNVWTIATHPYSGAHFATMPIELAERCIKAGSKPGDMVLDPFGGAGTTGLAAKKLGRSVILIELNSDYVMLAENRIETEQIPLI